MLCWQGGFAYGDRSESAARYFRLAALGRDFGRAPSEGYI
jgi:hypothetical protein